MICPFCDTEVVQETPENCASCNATINVRGGIQDKVQKRGIVLFIMCIVIVGIQIAGGNTGRALLLFALFALAGAEQYWRWRYKKVSPDDIRFYQGLDSRPPKKT